jgi:two-component system cell cycle sensor histidine kinase/response regulator CckA
MASDSTPARGPNTRAGAPGEILRILVIDESPRDRALIAESLRNGLPDSQVAEVRDPGELPAALERADFDVILADHRPSWIDAFVVLGKVRERHPDLPVILCTATGSEELAVAAMKAGFDDYVLKHPHHFPRLTSAIRSALAETTRRRIEREAETRYRTLFEGVPVGLYHSTSTGQVLDANPALLRMLGYHSREILMAANLCSLYVDHKAHDRMRRQLDTQGEVRDLEVCWKRYGGQLIWVRENIRAVRDPSGRLLGYEGLVEDITESRRARAELEESNQFREEIISGASEGIVVYDRALRRIVWNRYMEELTGIPAERALGGRAFDMTPTLRGPGLELLQGALEGQIVSSGDMFIEIEETGRSGWVVGTYGPHRNAAGEIVGVIGVIRSVTERRRNEQALRESEQRFRRVADAAPVMIWMDDAEGMSTYFNKPWLDFTGRTLEQELGRGSRDGIHPDDLLPRFIAVYDAAFTARRPFQTEYRLRRADGEYRWVLETATPRFTASGEFEGFAGTAIDITGRRRAEEALKESEARYRTQVENAPEAIVVFDVDAGRFVEANDNAARLWGLSRADFLEKDPVALSPALQPDGRPSAEAIAENIGRALDGETPLFEWIHRDALGRDIPCEVRLARLPSATRRLVRGSVTDISERKRAEKLQSALYRIAATTSATEDIDEFYRAIHAIVGELMYAKNFYVALHDAHADLISFPYCVDEVDPTPGPMPPGNGLTAHVLRTGEALLTLDEDFTEMVRRGDVQLVGSNSVAWLGVPLKRGGKTFGVLVVQSYDSRFTFGEAEKEVLTFVSQQIAVALERKRAQEAIRESEERYRLLFERNLAGVYRMTLVGRILECNDALARIFGYASREELVDRDMAVLYPDSRQRRDFFDALLRVRGLANFEMRGERKDGGTAWTFQNASLLADEQAGEIIVEGTVSDITERRHLEEQLRQSQKMEGIGQLAGGIAHDFNNLLTTVLGYSDMALSQLSAHDPIREDILEIRKAGERASNLTRQLLAFSRKQVFEPRVLDLNALIAESSRMLARLIGEHIRFVTELDPELASVRADPGQVEQVIVNLVVNARDAMPEGGALTMRTGNANVTAATARDHFGVAPGRYVVIAVADTGVGIDPETQKRIFEPFFTTKDKPHGTGLGLATVYGIVSQSGGHIFVASEPGRGSTFAIYLPRVEELASAAGAAAAPAAVRRGSETILLVEDEDAVRGLTLRGLQSSGYTVLQASSAEEALPIAARHAGRLDLLLTDVIMPGASGPELARRLLEKRPGTRVLYVSGYTDASMASQGADDGAFFLQKPFTPETLARKVREILDLA